MTKLEKGMKLEEEMTCEGYLDLLNRIKSRDFKSISSDEKYFLVLDLMSHAIIYVDSVKEIYDTVRVMGYTQELENSAILDPRNKVRLQFFKELKNFLTMGKKLNSMIKLLFNDEKIRVANDFMIEEHLKFHDKIMKMPHFTRQKAVTLINALGDDEEVMDDNKLPELKELHNLYIKADLKQDFVNYCKTYFKY